MLLKKTMVFDGVTRISKPIVWISFILGLVISWSVLSGDSLGRVNLLYLIILYVIFPCVSLIYSLLSYFYSPLQLGSLSTIIISFVRNNSFVFKKYKNQYLKLPQSNSPKLVLLYFSQLSAMSFSVASLLVLFVLLIASDVHFIWRSTLLDSEHILYGLQIIALPWQFWQDAQPTLEMISNSQDNRLFTEVVSQLSSSGTAVSTNWWQFVLATQIFYAFLMRFVVVLLLQLSFKFQTKSNSKYAKNVQNSNSTYLKERDNSVSKNQLFETSMKDITLDYALNNWANIPSILLDRIEEKLSGIKVNTINAGPSATDSERLIADRWRETQLIIVKSWEPPLAELSDFMQNSMGYLLPLDLKNEKIVECKDFHLQEWFRFVEKQPQWKLLLIPDLFDSSNEPLNNNPNDKS
ncbi:MAG: hypothetical protein COA86_12160 [Kangiella sp.]|nr:MAG: hypothetical protein COA86_12160 [Kangiella sp.]